jgi:hypothetical protein
MARDALLRAPKVAAAHRRCCAELELGKVAAKVVLGCEMDVVFADAKELAQLVEIEPLRRR